MIAPLAEKDAEAKIAVLRQRNESVAMPTSAIRCLTDAVLLVAELILNGYAQ